MTNRLIMIFTLTCLLVMPVMGSAAMTSTHFQIKTSVMSSAGGTMGSLGYAVHSVLGQPTPIMLQDNPPGSAGFTLYPGYLYTLQTSCFGDLSGDGDVDGQDLYIFLIGYPGAFNADDLIRFANEFGKTDCQ